MHDALLNRSLRLTIVGTIAIIALAGLLLCYQGLFDLIWSEWTSALHRFGWGAASVCAALLLIRYRGDLIDD